MLRAPLVSATWLANRLAGEQAATTKVLDASWHMPAQRRNPHEDFLAEHIPGSQFLDIDKVANTAHAVPHMLPTPDIFQAAMEGLGIGSGDDIVIYDTVGVFAAPRSWWALRVFGHDNVVVLDGGLPAWKAAQQPTESGTAAGVRPGAFQACYRPDLVADLERMLDNATRTEPGFQVMDARPRARWAGSEAEPRAGLASGHIPRSTCLPWSDLVERRADGVTVLRAQPQLAALFAGAGIDLDRPLVASCGSGLSACVLALAAAVCGNGAVGVYDGSWTEWAMAPNTPKCTL